jgi:hypothetical protein
LGLIKLLNTKLEILQSIFFVFILLFSFYGYGQFLIKLKPFNISHQLEKNCGLKALIGLGFFLCLSGYLELFKLGSNTILLTFTVIGLILSWIGMPTIQMSQLNTFIQANSLKRLAFTLLMLFLLGVTLLNVTFFPLNGADDFQGYVVFAKHILQEGYQGYDPFSVRLVEQGFGGGNFLNALFMAGSLDGNLHLTDIGIGLCLLFLIGISASPANSKKSLNIVFVFCIAVGVVIYAPVVNTAPLLLGCAFMYGVLFFSINMPPVCAKKQSFLFGFLLASFVILKGTFLIPAFLVAGTHYLWRLWFTRGSWVFKEIVFTLASFIFFLLPWLISNYYFHGTAFYPLMGKGFSNTGSSGLLTYAQFITNEFEFLPLYGLLLSSWLLLNSQAIDLKMKQYSTILVGTVIVGTTILAITPGGFFRYSYISLASPIAFLLTLYISNRANRFAPAFRKLPPKANKFILYFLISISAILMLHQTKRALVTFIKNGFLAAKGEDLNTKLDSYRQIQLLIPDKVIVVAQTTNPYLFDFSRNQIYVMDYPGNAGIKPGTPFAASPADLATYLRANNICYVVHSYFSWEQRRNDPRFLSDMNSSYAWNRNLSTRSYLINEQLIGFSKLFAVIYDNGTDRVFNICKEGK